MQILIQLVSSPVFFAPAVLGTSCTCWANARVIPNPQSTRRKQRRPGRAAKRAPSIHRLAHIGLSSFNGPVRCTRSTPEMRHGRDRARRKRIGHQGYCGGGGGRVEALAPSPVQALPGSSARSGTPTVFPTADLSMNFWPLAWQWAPALSTAGRRSPCSPSAR